MTYYFNPAAVDAGIYNVGFQAKVRVVESSDNTIDGSDAVLEFDIHPWKAHAPGNLLASDAEFCDKIELSWTSVDNVIVGHCDYGYYQLYCDGAPLDITINNSYTHFTSGSHDYKLAFVATCGGSCSNAGQQTSEVTGSTLGGGNPPSGVSATNDLCDGQVKITWQWFGDNPTDFKVRRNGSLLATVTGDIRDYTDNTAAPGVQYNYDVGAGNVCGTMYYSSVSVGSAIPDPQTPTAPVATANYGTNNINITWTNVANATQIELIRYSEAGTATFDLTAGTTSYVDNDAGGCITYTYKVKTINSCDYRISAVSNNARIEPVLTNTFTSTKNLVCSKGYYNDKIVLNWDYDNQNIIEHFKIYRKEYSESGIGSVIESIDPTSTYADETAEAGIYYVYTIVGETTCEGDILSTPVNTYCQDIGFRIPAAVVAGSVTFAGGTGVRGVSIIAETDDDFGGNGLYFYSSSSNIRVPHVSGFSFSSGFSFQAWVKATSTGTTTLFQKGTQYKVQHSLNNITFTAGSQVLNLNFPQKADTFFCVNAVRTTDSLFVYVLYDELTVYKTGALRTSATSSNSDDIYIGYSSNAFTGYIDEVRVWNKGLTQDQVYNTSIRYIAGNESELKVYLRLNELFNSTVYDISRISSNFNENHGFVSGCSLSSTIPLSRQLSVKGITDANGNYLITGIPYTIGSIYTFTPVFEVHKFDPTMKQLYIGPGSNNHNNVDFIDVASFTVSGDIRYINTFFPVKGVYFYVDGQILTMADGTPLETDDMGQYEIEVPIGFHYIEVRKNGHVFVNTGRFPATAPTKYNFQAPIPYLPFVDSTLIKVVGKVTGGPIQAAKPIGLSKTVNNIGYSEMALTTQRAYDLTDKFYDFTGSWFNNYYRDDELTIQDSTVFILKYLSPKEISIYPAHETGEYVAWLLPEKYVVNSITAGDYTYGDEFHTVLDLTNSYSFTTEIDSVVIDLAITTQGDTLLYYRIDSVQYNANFDFIYRELPSISVTKVNGDLDFWEKEYTTRDGAVIPLVNADSSLKTLFPVLFQRGRYSLKFSVFEQYINSDNNYAIDNVPVTDGKVDVQNALAIDKDLMSYQLDSKGEVIYNFTGGLPNITTGGIGDYIKTMAIVAKTGNNGSISTPWLPYTDPQTGAEGPFRAYLLGGLATGNNFVTTGPNEIKMIIRDPPGSNSFASLESGTTFSQSSSYEVGSELSLNNSIKVDLGMKQIIWAGVGAGTITEIEQIADVTIGLEMSTTFTDNNTTSTSFTTTETWSTSEADDYVGGDGDLFIGNSSNIVYGLSIQVDLAPINMGEGFVGNPIEYNGEIYDIGITKGLRINPEFGTGFIFSKYHIENYLIPNLKLLRKLYLLNHTDIYTCVICNPEDPNFGMKNTTGSLTSAGYSGGDSYNFTIPLDWPGDSLFVDTIDFFNQQIEGWIAALERNEKEKVQSEMVQNISFDAGASYSNTVTNEKSEEFTSSFAFMISPSLSSTLGFEIAGIGMEWNMEFKTSATITNTNGTTQSTTTTFSYTLKDENAGDYLSVDIKKPKTQTGPVFITRGGQTMCPYEDAEITEYYQPGTLLGAATMRREIPIITCENPLQTDVLDGEPAIFHVQLSNISETGEDQWFLLSIDAASNQEGAYISMDGSDLGGGVMLLVAAGVTMNKYIYVEKIRPDHFEYENLAIVLGSSCQDDLTDTVRISAYFKPVCTTVELKTPSDLWVVNTNSDTTLSIKVDGYDLGHQSLEKILMQYRPTSTSSWTTLMSYYMYVVDFDIASEPKALIDGQSYLTYKFDMTGVQDRDYALRAVSVCFDGTVNETSAAYGVKDVKRPKVFGTPQPADGILSPGDDVMITFDENIEAGILTPWNFSVKGVLNGAPLMHQACLFFDGQQDYASSVTGVNLDNKSFTIEFWTRRGDLSEGVIFSQNELEIGFNSAGNFYCTLGDQTFQSWSINSAPVISDLVSWAHYSITYNIEDNYFSMFINDIQELVDIPVTNMFNCEGRMYIGRNSVGTKFFNGFLHEFRIWEKSLGFGTIASMRYQSLVGNEIGLGGYWTMSEASGDNTADKARNRNLFLFGAEWRVFPSGYSRVFNGNDEYVIINTGSTVVIDDLMDFTIEFYFKGQPQANTVLFSNGSANGIDDTPPYMHIWVVGFNVNGKLYVRNNGTTITANQEDFLDGAWHHFALVMNRKANTSIYIDGSLVKYEQSMFFGGLVGAEMALGARRQQTSVFISYYDFFTGNMDEVRIWNLARTVKQLNMDMNSKLKGDEMGLLAYYPLDIYNFLGTDLISNLDDQVEGSGLVATAVGGSATNVDVPNLKDARPVQQIAYNWVVNEDQIVITVNEQPSAIERCILEFTVDRVEDLRENRIASPVTWTAYVKKNTVIWDADRLYFEKLLYAELTFDVDILNIGGTDQNFSISNLPAWLTASETGGTLSPDNYQTITFTVSPVVNIGDYEASVFLTSDFGYNEQLSISLKVRKTSPSWTVNPTDFQYSMNVIGQIQFDQTFSTNSDDKVAAFVDGECRGVANSTYVKSYDMFEVNLTIYSNVAYGEQILYKVWNAGEGVIHTEVLPIDTFLSNSIHGTPSNPVIIRALGTYQEDIPLYAGWNWLSLNLNSYKQANINWLFDGMNMVQGDQVKDKQYFEIYDAIYGWSGSLSAHGGIKNESMYLVKSANAQTLTVVGNRINPLTTPISISTGWNYLGYLPALNISVDEALASLSPSQGDVIKCQSSFAMYDNYTGWIGNLDYMKPFVGYMYYANAPGILYYPEFGTKSGFSFTGDKMADLYEKYNINCKNYMLNMTISGILQNEYGVPVIQEMTLLAYEDSICVGVTPATWNNASGNHNYFLTAFSNSGLNNITFKAEAENGTIYNIVEEVNYQPNGIVGSPSLPIVLTIEGFYENTTQGNDIHAYPNPFVNQIKLFYDISDAGNVRIQVYNILGEVVSVLSNRHHEAGHYQLIWQTSEAGTNIPDGIYFVELKNGAFSKILKVSKIK